ncbi:MAG: hypothetical protein WAN17_03005, partial [Candidatus Sulfotelmatobacter sp.]
NAKPSIIKIIVIILAQAKQSFPRALDVVTLVQVRLALREMAWPDDAGRRGRAPLQRPGIAPARPMFAAASYPQAHPVTSITAARDSHGVP